MDDAAVERLLADLARWSGDRRAEEAAESRRDEAWLRRQAEEDARFTGVALDVAEQAESVTVRTSAGRLHHGHIVAVAEDFLVLRSAGGPPVLVPSSAVTVLRPAPGARAHDAASTRRAPVGARFAHALAGLADDRPRVGLVVQGGEALTGELRTVGRDVCTLRLEGGGGVYVRVDALTEVTVFG